MGGRFLGVVQTLQSWSQELGPEAEVEAALYDLQYMPERAPLVYGLLSKCLLSNHVGTVTAALSLIEVIGRPAQAFIPALRWILTENNVDILYAALGAMSSMDDLAASGEGEISNLLAKWKRLGRDAWIIPSKAAETLARTTYCARRTLIRLLTNFEATLEKEPNDLGLCDFAFALRSYRGRVQSEDISRFKNLQKALSSDRELSEVLLSASFIFETPRNVSARTAVRA